uniref:Uncharacterized protein n=1 Tax=Avena sativa TaxID=4498 RepID=A0ACD5XC78_AVESA
MRRLVFAELVVLAAAASVALVLLTVHCCRRGWSGSKQPPEVRLPVSEPRQLPGARKERSLERLRRALLRLCSRRSRVEPAAASAATSPDAQGEVVVAVQVAAAAGPEEEVAAWRERWFGGPGSRALYTIDEESSTSSWTPTAVSEGDVESQCGGDRQAEPETPFYTPPASPLHEAEQLNGETS